MTVIPIVIGALSTVTKGLVQELGNKRTSGNLPNYSIIKIGQNIEKSPGNLRRLTVTQIPAKKTSANAGVKNSQKSNNNNNCK